MNIILFGAPGSGKGTLSNNLLKKVNYLVHLAPGDLLRQEIADNTELGQQAKHFINEGKLVPDQLIFELNTNFMKQHLIEKKGFLFDGYPRSLSQNQQLISWLNLHNQKIDYIFFLKIDFSLIKERILYRLVCSHCGAIYNLKNNAPIIENKCDKCHQHLTKRNDDNLETIKKRFDTYLEKTAELINHYASQNNFFELDASLKEEDLTKKVLNIINKSQHV